MKRRTLQRAKHSFTLIELLVAVSIIAVLAALSIKAFQRAIDTARAAGCSANLRNLATAWQSYCADHDGAALPYMSTPQTSWAYKLIPYLTGRDNAPLGNSIACPAAIHAAAAAASPGSYNSSYQLWTGVANGMKNSGYGYNYYWYSDPESLGTGASATILAQKFYRRTVNARSDEGPIFADAVWADFRRDPSVPTNFKNPSSTITCAIIRHKGKGINMAFTDGSVRFVTMGQLFSEIRLNPADTIDPSWINQIPPEYR